MHKNIFFIFGLHERFCNKPFTYIHYLNILSAHIFNPEYKIFVYFRYKPNSIWFDKLQSFCIFEQIDYTKQTHYIEHIGDILRLELLQQHGGVYLDIDCITLKSFNCFSNESIVLGEEFADCPIDHNTLHVYFPDEVRQNNQNQSLIGLCNATIIAQSNISFIENWLQLYVDDYKRSWNYNSVIVPYVLSKKHPCAVQPQNTFFKFSWDSIGTSQLFEDNLSFLDCHTVHLWQNKTYSYLQKIDSKYIENTNNTIANIYKYVLTNDKTGIY